MQITVESAISLLDEYWLKRDFNNLKQLALEITQQKPETPQALRYLGVHGVLTGDEVAEKYFHRAALLNDQDSKIWLGVLNNYRYHSRGSLSSQEILAQVELEKLRNSRYMDFPTEVTIETQAVCNAKCNFCPYPTMERQGDKMSDGLIDKIIQDLRQIPSDLPFSISPFKVSDPFLDKRIFSILTKINLLLPQARLRLFTNGSPLTKSIIEQIALVQKVTHLWISLNESEPGEYEKVMGLPFFKTVEKLDLLHKYVGDGYPHKVTLSRVADSSHRDQAFIDFVSTRYPLFDCFLIGRSDWTGQVSLDLNKKVPQIACGRWYELSIMASGKVALCCMDGQGKYVVGDVNTDSALDIYNSPEYRKMRQYTFTRLAAADPCSTCIT
jgi:hypothetical protein